MDEMCNILMKKTTNDRPNIVCSALQVCGGRLMLFRYLVKWVRQHWDNRRFASSGCVRSM